MTPFSIVIVTFNSERVLAEVLRSIPKGHEAIVVDNASTDGCRDVARELGAILVENSENLGFGRACNIGAKRASNERLLFLNPDARLEVDTLDRLATAMSAHPECLAFNPRFLNGDGRQFFRRRTRLVRRPYLFRFPVPTADRRIFFAFGAALAMRRAEFVSLGGFDENIFLFYEDDDLSARILRSRRGIYYCHDAIVHHSGGESSGRSVEVVAFKAYQEMLARKYVYEKYGIRFFAPIRIVVEYVRSKMYYLNGNDFTGRIYEARLLALLGRPL